MHRKDLEEALFQAPVGHLCHCSHLLNIQQNDNTNSKSNQCFFCAGLCCLPRTHPAQHIPTTGPLHLPFRCLTSPSLSHPSGSPLPTSSSSLCQCHLASETTPVHPRCNHPRHFLPPACFLLSFICPILCLMYWFAIFSPHYLSAGKADLLPYSLWCPQHLGRCPAHHRCSTNLC